MKAQTTVVDHEGSVPTVGAFLLVVGRDSYGTYNLPENGSLTIGRGETNEVRIDDPLASRNHARLYVNVGEGMFLEDLGSINGTRVKDLLVKPGDRVAVAAGETISIGSSVLIIQRRSRIKAPLVRPETLRDRALEPTPGPDEAMRRIYVLAERAAAGPINVLITGETGVGKELLAETVHRLSPRKNGPYVCLNCAALSESLLESELFGHERGAFTGAFAAKPGLLETAAGGTLFLDEVGELPLATQAKLLRVLETREVSRLGSLKPRFDRRSLHRRHQPRSGGRGRAGRVPAGSVLPAQRHHADHPAAARARVGDSAAGRDVCAPDLPRDGTAGAGDLAGRDLAAGGLPLARQHPRAEELHGARGPAVHRRRHPAGAPALREDAPRRGRPVVVAAEPPAAETDRSTTPESERERQRIVEALNACAGNQSRAAKMLGIPRRTFVAKLDAYRIPRPKKALSDE